MTWARHQGELLEVINVYWPKRVFDYLKDKYPKAKVSVKDQRGNISLVDFRDLEWDSVSERKEKQ